MAKPQTLDGYEPAVTDACERVLVTLLRGLGPWKESVFLVGGLAPRYLVTARPPQVPAHVRKVATGRRSLSRWPPTRDDLDQLGQMAGPYQGALRLKPATRERRLPGGPA